MLTQKEGEGLEQANRPRPCHDTQPRTTERSKGQGPNGN